VVSFGDSFEVVSLVCFRLESVMVVFLEVQPRDLYLAAGRGVRAGDLPADI
jgi:hypothetical protein